MTKNRLKNLKVGYVPMAPSLLPPGDRRRFVYYARERGIDFEIATPDKKYDVVVVTARGDISAWSRYTQGKVIFDMVDPYLTQSKYVLKDWLRGLAKFIVRQNKYLNLNYKEAIKNMCRHSKAIVCAGPNQKTILEGYCKNTHVILDIHNDSAPRRKTNYTAVNPFKIVWEGLPENLVSIGLIKEVLQKINKKHPIQLHLITDRECYKYLGNHGKTETRNLYKNIFDDIVFHEWDEKTFNDNLISCDLAIIPADLSDPFRRVKSMSKLLLLWRAGMPVVTSASEEYTRVMTESGVELDCYTNEDWEKNILKCLEDASFRKKVGDLGFDYSEREFSKEKILSQWDCLFESVL